MEFHNVSNHLPHASPSAEALRQTRPVRPVEPVARVRNDSDRPEPERPRVDLSRLASGDMEFRIDKDTDQLIVSIYDSEGELLRQIPADVVLELARRIDEVLARNSFGLNTEA